MVATRRYLFTSVTFVSFFDGRVPCSKCALVRRNSGHSACMGPQVAQLVNGSRSTPANMSCTDARLITESWVCFVNEQI